MLHRLGICFLLVVLVAGSVLAEDMLNQKPFQMYIGGGVLGQITMSRYRDGESIPYELHMDALIIPQLSLGARYMRVPLSPGESYEVDGVSYSENWFGSKNLILGRVGWIFPQESSHFGIFAHGGYSYINVDWGQNSTAWEQVEDTLTPGALTFGGSILARSNLGVGKYCTPINVWAEMGYFYSIFSEDDSITISSSATRPPADAIRSLFTLAAGLEVNFFVPCPDFGYKKGQHWSDSK
ncbi:MAG TPA: hypothetical protein ENN07_00175 [candidate division Zixibacteria bacterium]|nr:hypothetical protein [candidate division Zixibacteria bacterium]